MRAVFGAEEDNCLASPARASGRIQGCSTVEFFHPLLQKTSVLQNVQILQERLQQEQVRIASSTKQQKDLPEGF